MPSALASDATKPIFVRCVLKLSEDEIRAIQDGIPKIAADLVFAGMGRGFASAADTISALSTPEGRQTLSKAERDLRSAITEIGNGKRPCKLEITIDPRSGSANSGDPIGAAFVAFLDSRLPPQLSLFSYFPADRAIPAQDPPVQIGIADAGLQIESHNSQPQLKYQRLKSTIFNAVITSEEERIKLTEEFARIFERVLKGRRLLGVGVNQYGALSVVVEDTESGKQFPLDAMSSGEKGLILTFLLIARSVSNGGIVILDEPELHLNPAVCKDLLSFLAEEYVSKSDLQLIVCSHSPEILSGAFSRDDCTLYHLVSGTNLTEVRRQDQEEVTEALRRLGTSESEGLLYRATVFVEGEHDADTLEAGFEALFRRYKLKDLGGRKEVEKQVRSLQEAEVRGIAISPRYFIFDRDESPTDLKSSENVRVLQWSRRCLENYLLDFNALTDLLKEQGIAGKPVRNVGQLQSILKRLAKEQLNGLVAKSVYEKYAFENPGLRPQEIEGKTFAEISSVLFKRLQTVKKQLEPLVESDWNHYFLAECEQMKESQEEIWDAKWIEDCDGKRLFKDLQKELQIRMSLQHFKRLVMTQMRNERSEDWRTVESRLKELLSGPGPRNA
jgi:hypothetical protein